MKLRRSDRMVVISNYLINNPYKLTSLNTFAEKYESAKSSISEDMKKVKSAISRQLQVLVVELFSHHQSPPSNQKQLSKSFAINFQRATVFFQVAISIYLIYLVPQLF